jgi:two-component system OmpR family sensor kinase
MPGKTERLLEMIERLLESPATELKLALTHASDLASESMGAEKVDAFMFDSARNSLVSVGSSMQKLSDLQRRQGLDILPIANGGRVVEIFQSGKPFVNGHVESDSGELRGIREALRIRSELGVPMMCAEERRGVLLFASQQPEVWSEEDVRFATTISRWVGMVAHRAELVEAISRNSVEQGRRAVAEELITMLAHDLRNYIAPIDFRIKMMRRKAEREGRKTDEEELGLTVKSVARLTALVSEILDAARIDQGVFPVQLEPIALNDVVGDIAAACATPDHPVRVQASREAVVIADARLLRQCLSNVITNAVKHSPNEAPVAVSISKERRDRADWIRVEVVDEGPGIPPALLPHVFERFVTDHRGGGLGLGLYMAKRIAALQGGELTAESPPGKGARFSLTLRCHDGC